MRLSEAATNDPPWSLGTLVDIYSRTYFQREEPRHFEKLKELLEAPLPEGAQRFERGDLIVFKWVADLCEENRTNAARSQQHVWMGETLKLSRKDGFNEQGDMRDPMSGLRGLAWAPHEHLTFYGAGEREGFQTMVQNPGGSLDEERLAELIAWKTAGELPDGSQIKTMNLIFPNRESVVALHQRLRGMGFDRILYTDDNGETSGTSTRPECGWTSKLRVTQIMKILLRIAAPSECAGRTSGQSVSAADAPATTAHPRRRRSG